MSARYWKTVKPNLSIPTDLETWKQKFIDRHKASTPRGASIRRIYENLQSLESDINTENTTFAPASSVKTRALGLRIEAYTPIDINTTQNFLRVNYPIPTTLIFDRSLALTNQPGGYHAVLFHSVDFKKEKIYLIDPTLVDLKQPFPLDLARFNEGWKAYDSRLGKNDCKGI